MPGSFPLFINCVCMQSGQRRLAWFRNPSIQSLFSFYAIRLSCLEQNQATCPHAAIRVSGRFFFVSVSVWLLRWRSGFKCFVNIAASHSPLPTPTPLSEKLFFKPNLFFCNIFPIT